MSECNHTDQERDLFVNDKLEGYAPCPICQADTIEQLTQERDHWRNVANLCDYDEKIDASLVGTVPQIAGHKPRDEQAATIKQRATDKARIATLEGAATDFIEATHTIMDEIPDSVKPGTMTALKWVDAKFKLRQALAEGGGDE